MWRVRLWSSAIELRGSVGCVEVAGSPNGGGDPDRPPSPAATLYPTLGYLEAEEFAQSFSLGPAHGNFCLLLVVHSQLVGTLEPGDDFLDAVDVHQVGAVGAPEKIGIEAVQ